MAALFNPTILRVLVLAAALACVAALTAPTARGEASHETLSSLACPTPSGPNLLADEFSWHDFILFWQRQMGSMTGVVGTVMLVAAAAVLIIMSKGRG
jgi:hypothetical protein